MSSQSEQRKPESGYSFVIRLVGVLIVLIVALALMTYWTDWSPGVVLFIFLVIGLVLLYFILRPMVDAFDVL